MQTRPPNVSAGARGRSRVAPFCCWRSWRWCCGRLNPRNCTRSWPRTTACASGWGLVACRTAARLRGDWTLRCQRPKPKFKPRASAIDGRLYQAQGPLWHVRDRAQARIPPGLRNVDPESAWSKSGYRGWVQGYRLVLQGLVFPAPVPLFAHWCPNSVGESTVLEEALAADQLPITELLLGDSTFGGADLVATYAQHGGWLLTPQQLPANPDSWKRDLYAYRRETIELLFQRLIQACDLKACPTKGLARTGTFVIASVWLYQVLFLDNHRHHRPVAHIKEIIDEGRWRIAA